MPYRKHLSKDLILKKLIKQQGGYVLERKKNIHLHLCASIISQQLSTKVAAVIYARFMQLFNKRNPRPEDILSVTDEAFKSVGLSNSKASHIKNVCRFFIENKLTDAKLHKLSDEELVELLTQIKGVGRWTVEMLLMFTLGREDVFSVGDLGLQKAMIELYNIEYANKQELASKMEAIAERWRPYRTYACRYLWRYRDAPLVPM